MPEKRLLELAPEFENDAQAAVNPPELEEELPDPDELDEEDDPLELDEEPPPPPDPLQALKTWVTIIIPAMQQVPRLEIINYPFGRGNAALNIHPILAQHCRFEMTVMFQPGGRYCPLPATSPARACERA